MDVKEQKRRLRTKIWNILDENGVACFPLPSKGRIPNFIGSERAANRIQTFNLWHNARIIFANPDYAQRKVRELVLKDNKILIMATPKLKRGYLEIRTIPGKERFLSTISGAFKYGTQISELPKPDLIITGCVAVDREGWRLGKGGGYGDKEIEIITQKFGKCIVITTVHDLQVVESVPHDEHDAKIDIILTPTKIQHISSPLTV